MSTATSRVKAGKGQKVSDGKRPPLKTLVSDSERNRIRSGFMKDFSSLCVFLLKPKEGTSPWKNISLDNLATLPVRLTGKITITIRKTRFFLHLLDEPEPVEVLVFSRIESGTTQ